MNKQNQESVWIIDPVHTRIRFKTKYLLISGLSGWFTDFEGKVISSSDHFHNSQIQLSVYTNSIFTGNEERDQHLRSVDFFETKKYPIITFNSTGTRYENEKLEVEGELRIKNITKEIIFEASYRGSASDDLGNLKAGFDVTLTLNRKDFDVKWNQVLDKKGLLVSDEVRLLCDVQLLKIR